MSDSRTATSAVWVGAAAQFGVQPWYTALPLPVAEGPPHEVHCTCSTDRVPSAVSWSDDGRCCPLPTAPSKYTGVAWAVGFGRVVLEAFGGAATLVGAVTVLVVVDPQPASTISAAGTARRFTCTGLTLMPTGPARE